MKFLHQRREKKNAPAAGRGEEQVAPTAIFAVGVRSSKNLVARTSRLTATTPQRLGMCDSGHKKRLSPLLVSSGGEPLELKSDLFVGPFSRGGWHLTCSLVRRFVISGRLILANKKGRSGSLVPTAPQKRKQKRQGYPYQTGHPCL